ncbi:acyl-CoA thioesterase-2 [Quadrisphaera granulorum]|uniref:Acyl-CoA thioesterase-2 n=1 Tax=Quadrisphaera granulorum TaxID=317664 RepID=A0A316A7I3_9ACTN|nr:acyl-CoA thioesterase domain-containing protein [Quadrisphaera granulorum]PWJ53563.1 acyl-CoA thioesterase-2 [Quadrisphaera granulorum]SZE96905.1 acyl-CoA thioesterase-2 [Quadrisphaera granulorum]
MSERLPLLDSLALVKDVGADDDVYVASHQRIPSGRAYGGELVAQALEAARRTVADLPDSPEADQRRVHSLHAYFLRPVDVTQPSRWTVERTRDGRGFSARRVVGQQGGKAVLMAMASFHVPVDGDDELRHDPPAAGPGALGGFADLSDLPGSADPAALPSTADRLAGTEPGRDTEYWSHGRSVDLRHAEDAVYTSPAGERVARQVVWVRTLERLPDDPALHRTVLAYLCDYTALEPALRVHGLAWADPGLVTASVDHAMWWHEDGRADEWVALVQDSPVARRGTALGRLSIVSRDGRLLATAVQEGVVRVAH